MGSHASDQGYFFGHEHDMPEPVPTAPEKPPDMHEDGQTAAQAVQGRLQGRGGQRPLKR